MDYKPLHRVAVAPIDAPRATQYKSETGFEVELVIGTHNEDTGYWTNNHFEVVQDGFSWKKGDKVVVNYVKCGEAFGHYSDATYGNDIGEVLPDGRKVYFFLPEDIELTIRDGAFIAPMGKLIVTQVEKPNLSPLVQMEKLYERDIYDVVAVGEFTPEHKLPMTNTNKISTYKLTEVEGLKAGDRVLMQKNKGYPIESPMNKKLDKEYWVMRLTDVMGLIV